MRVCVCCATYFTERMKLTERKPPSPLLDHLHGLGRCSFALCSVCSLVWSPPACASVSPSSSCTVVMGRRGDKPPKRSNPCSSLWGTLASWDRALDRWFDRLTTGALLRLPLATYPIIVGVLTVLVVLNSSGVFAPDNAFDKDGNYTPDASSMLSVAIRLGYGVHTPLPSPGQPR
jgi:hypothetical protein